MINSIFSLHEFFVGLPETFCEHFSYIFCFMIPFISCPVITIHKNFVWFSYFLLKMDIEHSYPTIRTQVYDESWGKNAKASENVLRTSQKTCGRVLEAPDFWVIQSDELRRSLVLSVHIVVAWSVILLSCSLLPSSPFPITENSATIHTYFGFSLAPPISS